MTQQDGPSYIELVLDELQAIQHDFQELTREVHSPNSKIILGRLYNRFTSIQQSVHELKKDPSLAIQVPASPAEEIEYKFPERQHTDPELEEIEQYKSELPKLTAEEPESERSLLVIDDDETTHLIVKAAFKKQGIKVYATADPTTAMQDLLRLKPNFVILDILMPQVNGFEVLSKIRSQEAFNDIIIIVGSSRSYDKDRIAAIELGADEFIAKPYQINELVNKVKSLYEIKFGKSALSA